MQNDSRVAFGIRDRAFDSSFLPVLQAQQKTPLTRQRRTGVVTVTLGCPRQCFGPRSSGNDLMPGGHRIGARLTEGSAGNQVALQVELIVNGSMEGQKPLHRAR